MRNPVDDAVAALQRGEQAKAFTLLRTRLTQEPKDALAWLWMSEATPDLSRKLEALERFIALAPDHPRVPSARMRMSYLELQIGRQQRPAAPPTEPADKAGRSMRTAEARDESAPPPQPTRGTAPVMPQATSQPAPRIPDTARIHTEPAAPPKTGVAPTPMKSNATAPHIYHPAMPELLKSLLDTAPMPRVRTDLPVAPAAPPIALDDTATGAAPPEDELQEDAAPVESIAATAPRIVSTPWWAWAMLFLMTIQLALMVYIILRLEFLAAAIP